MPGVTEPVASRPARPPFRRRRALLLLVLAALALLPLLAEGVHAMLLRLVLAAQNLAAHHPGLAALAVLVFAALSAMLAFVSSAALAPFMSHVWGTVAAFLLLWVGWLLGGVLSYGIGRYLGRPVVARLIPEHRLARYEEQVSRHTPFGLLLLLQLALPSEIPGYLLGLVRCAFPRYVLALALAELPYALATVYLGWGVVERRISLILAVGAGTLLLSLGAFYALHRRLPPSPPRPSPEAAGARSGSAGASR
jgi:uncharacterized membrane protein YdjX (TVP38/TMEM64 family)